MVSQSYVLQSSGLQLEISPSVASESEDVSNTGGTSIFEISAEFGSKLRLEDGLEALDAVSLDATVARPLSIAFPALGEDEGDYDEDDSLVCSSPTLSFYTAYDDEMDVLEEPCEEKPCVRILAPLFDMESRCATPTFDRSVRRARSVMDIDHIGIESSPRNLFRRDSDPGSAKDDALKSHILDLEEKLAEANKEIWNLNQEVEDLTAAKDDQEAVLSGAEQQVEEVLRRNQELERHFKNIELQQIELQRQQEEAVQEIELYKADTMTLHEMVYTYQSMLIECGIAHSSLRFHNSLEAMRARLSHRIKVPREYPGLGPDVASTLAHASNPAYVPLPASPEPPSLPPSPRFLASMESSEYLEGLQLMSCRDSEAAEALAVPRPGSPMPN